jgi:hypothetical protein
VAREIDAGGTASPRATRIAAAATALAAAAPATLLFGFTVDDALIPARYAANLAAGHGYRFNAGGPVTDGVTPLGFAWLLAPFAGGGPLAALAAAKLLGVVAWIAAASAIGAAIARASDRPLRFAALGLVAVSAPLAAWSGAGLETGLVTAIAASAVVLGSRDRPVVAALVAGLAAALRPEMLPWALVLALSPPLRAGGASPARAWIARVAVAAAPFALVAGIRAIAFGRAAPLSVLAKPPDASLGASYALACFLLTGPVALVAPFAFARLDRFARGLVLATLAHFVAVALAGGDWMPLSRLVVPALPGAALAAAHVASVSAGAIAAARLALAMAGEVFALVRVGPAAARVMDDRLALVAELRPALAEAHAVATVDAGWVGAATAAAVVDLAGVIDPAVAALPGGHTSKRVPAALLDAREVDVLVLLLAEGEELREPWTASRFARGTEVWISTLPGVADAFSPVVVSRVPGLRYVVLRRRPERVARAAADEGSTPLGPSSTLPLGASDAPPR